MSPWIFSLPDMERCRPLTCRVTMRSMRPLLNAGRPRPRETSARGTSRAPRLLLKPEGEENFAATSKGKALGLSPQFGECAPRIVVGPFHLSEQGRVFVEALRDDVEFEWLAVEPRAPLASDRPPVATVTAKPTDTGTRRHAKRAVSADQIEVDKALERAGKRSGRLVQSPGDFEKGVAAPPDQTQNGDGLRRVSHIAQEKRGRLFVQRTPRGFRTSARTADTALPGPLLTARAKVGMTARSVLPEAAPQRGVL